MRRPRIFSATKLAAHSEITLDEQAAHHLVKVLRCAEGTQLTLFDGHGGEYPATLTHAGKRVAQAQTADHLQRNTESPLQVVLGIAMSKGDRMDWVVQKATELGVSCIQPLVTERTELKLRGERAEKKQRHWQRVAISACEQCERNTVPEVALPTSLENWVESVSTQRRFVLHHRAHAAAIDAGDAKPSSVAVLVGPEGGLSDLEIQLAADRGFAALAMGPRVLRTETAPLVALALLQSAWGDMPFTGAELL